jgi:diketogulonate reductase-like aldo/keto reductase
MNRFTSSSGSPRSPRRRKILGGLLATGAGLAAGLPRWAGSTESPGMRSRPIPSSGEALPVIGLGTSRTFDVDASAEARAPLKDVISALVAGGGTLVDTAPMYGRAEAVVGDLVLELGLGQKIFMATKVLQEGREEGIRQMEESLGLLRSEPLDLMQVHNLVGWRTQLATLREWKKAGRIRYLGITHYRADAHQQLMDILQAEPLDFVQINYSLAEPEAAARLLPMAADKGVAVLINRPFARAALFDKVRGVALPDWAAEFDCHSWAQYFLKYILGHPAVTCAIPATRKAHYMVDNAGAGTGRLPDQAMRRRMEVFFRQL